MVPSNEKHNTRLKLALYVSIATLSSLMSDLSHYTCPNEGLDHITTARWITIVLGFIVQGCIAWRAFIDGSYERDALMDTRSHSPKLPRKKLSPGRLKKKA